MRPLALPLAVITSRLPKVEPGTRQPVCPGASDLASRSSDCSGLAFVPGFVSAPLGAAHRLQRTATGLPPATPTSTLETMIAATTGAPLSTVESVVARPHCARPLPENLPRPSREGAQRSSLGERPKHRDQSIGQATSPAGVVMTALVLAVCQVIALALRARCACDGSGPSRSRSVAPASRKNRIGAGVPVE